MQPMVHFHLLHLGVDPHIAIVAWRYGEGAVFGVYNADEFLRCLRQLIDIIYHIVGMRCYCCIAQLIHLVGFSDVVVQPATVHVECVIAVGIPCSYGVSSQRLMAKNQRHEGIRRFQIYCIIIESAPVVERDSRHSSQLFHFHAIHFVMMFQRILAKRTYALQRYRHNCNTHNTALCYCLSSHCYIYCFISFFANLAKNSLSNKYF